MAHFILVFLRLQFLSLIQHTGLHTENMFLCIKIERPCFFLYGARMHTPYHSKCSLENCNRKKAEKKEKTHTPSIFCCFYTFYYPTYGSFFNFSRALVTSPCNFVIFAFISCKNLTGAYVKIDRFRLVFYIFCEFLQCFITVCKR